MHLPANTTSPTATVYTASTVASSTCARARVPIVVSARAVSAANRQWQSLSRVYAWCHRRSHTQLDVGNNNVNENAVVGRRLCVCRSRRPWLGFRRSFDGICYGPCSNRHVRCGQFGEHAYHDYLRGLAIRIHAHTLLLVEPFSLRLLQLLLISICLLKPQKINELMSVALFRKDYRRDVGIEEVLRLKKVTLAGEEYWPRS